MRFFYLTSGKNGNNYKSSDHLQIFSKNDPYITVKTIYKLIIYRKYYRHVSLIEIYI